MIPAVLAVAVHSGKGNFWTNRRKRQEAARRLAQKEKVHGFDILDEEPQETCSSTKSPSHEVDADGILSSVDERSACAEQPSIGPVESVESSAMAPCPSARGLPVYVRNSQGDTQMVELSPSATVFDLRQVAAAAGQDTRGVLSYQGRDLVDDTACLSNLGIGPESLVDLGSIRTVQVTVQWNKGMPRQDTFDIPAVDLDGFLATLRSKVLEKMKAGPHTGLRPNYGIPEWVIQRMDESAIRLEPEAEREGMSARDAGLSSLLSIFEVDIAELEDKLNNGHPENENSVHFKIEQEN